MPQSTNERTTWKWELNQVHVYDHSRNMFLIWKVRLSSGS